MTDDPFDLLGLPAVFDLGGAQLERAYLSKAAGLHPDMAGDDAETLARSAALNHARDILRNPEPRADALLGRLGGPGKSQDKTLPDGFLMDIMETREAIEEATRGRDRAEIDRWMRWAEARRAEYVSAVSALFAGLGPTPAPAALRRVRQELNAWRYIERLIEQLDPEYDPAEADRK